MVDQAFFNKLATDDSERVVRSFLNFGASYVTKVIDPRGPFSYQGWLQLVNRHCVCYQLLLLELLLGGISPFKRLAKYLSTGY